MAHEVCYPSHWQADLYWFKLLVSFKWIMNDFVGSINDEMSVLYAMHDYLNVYMMKVF